MWSESTRYSFSGGIEYPHFRQRVLSDAFTFSRLIFTRLACAANYMWVRRPRLSTYMGCALKSTISTRELLAKRRHSFRIELEPDRTWQLNLSSVSCVFELRRATTMVP
jgi:hypothetical protein